MIVLSRWACHSVPTGHRSMGITGEEVVILHEESVDCLPDLSCCPWSLLNWQLMKTNLTQCQAKTIWFAAGTATSVPVACLGLCHKQFLLKWLHLLPYRKVIWCEPMAANREAQGRTRSNGKRPMAVTWPILSQLAAGHRYKSLPIFLL